MDAWTGSASTAERLRQRREAILAALADGPLAATDLRQRLRPRPAARTLFTDLEWLAARFPDQVQRSRGGDARQVFWSLRGPAPSLLPRPLDALTHDELAALIAARGLLRAPDHRHPGWERPSTPYAGDLSAALHGLLVRAGLDRQARGIAPTTIGVSRFGIGAEAPGAVAGIERCLRTGQAARFRYRNQSGQERAVHVWPIRLVLIKGEWYCFAWAPGDRPDRPGRVKQYALSRVTSRDPAIAVERRLPPGAPARQPHAEVDAILASGFQATGGGPRQRVVLACSPAAWPFLAGRTWGEAQEIAADPPDLPAGWHRLTFSTTGLDECRHWVLSFGLAVRAEQPADLRRWLAQQAQGVIDALGSDPTPMPATPAAANAVTISATTA